MFRYALSVFASPETFLQIMTRQDINDSIADGERIIIDENGNASVNITSDEVREDFARHVNALKGV
ncbi:MAG: hypothetical protein QRY16_10905 [Enterobacterales bacterium endosymbiont of Blomia tropicalis]|uniref:hypothetical protein n=1 Tax=Mixta mediterraneensis TaxID=2758443 RepID=UPI00187533CA|nr:hypothetical protein [Mixta mediterraneensis]MBE5253125.1 hypothetical protein [Mixta mediterraneensis]MDL4914275.1 hypothetical protein [Mixta mediterraneensis]